MSTTPARKNKKGRKFSNLQGIEEKLTHVLFSRKSRGTVPLGFGLWPLATCTVITVHLQLCSSSRSEITTSKTNVSLGGGGGGPGGVSVVVCE